MNDLCPKCKAPVADHNVPVQDASGRTTSCTFYECGSWWDNDLVEFTQTADCQLDTLQKKNDELTEWRGAVSSAVKSIPEFASGEWAGDKEGWGYHFELINWLRRERTRLMDEVNKLQAIIDTHDLCHDMHGKVGANEFAQGCAQEQRKLYGCAPHADEVIKLRALLSAAQQELLLCVRKDDKQDQINQEE